MYVAFPLSFACFSFVTLNVNGNIQVFAQSEKFEIKALGATYPETTSPSSPSSSGSGSSSGSADSPSASGDSESSDKDKDAAVSVSRKASWLVGGLIAGVMGFIL